MQPFLAKGLCLLLDQLHGGLLLIWWGLVLAQDQRDHQPQLGPQALALGPVQKQVLAQILGSLVGGSLEHVLVSMSDERNVSSPGEQYRRC